MTTMERQVAHRRLMDLKRIVALLNGQLRALQQELDQTDAQSLTHHPWLIRQSPRRHQLFMSAICNRHIRPNLRRPATDTSQLFRQSG
ncbi:MAG: hypothetical protein NZM29_04240 [Nitrospira sp.]|nr:hypothetical protein [Nitrospira sp.]